MEQRDLEEVIVLNIGYKNEYCCFFPCYEIFMGKPMDSSCDVDYHRVELHGKEQPYFGMMVNCFCGMVYRRKALSLISSRGHCQRFSSSQIFDTPQAKLKSGLNLSSGFEERSYAVVINEFMMYGYLSSLHRIGFVAFFHAMRN